jgi:hypothetical protein
MLSLIESDRGFKGDYFLQGDGGSKLLRNTGNIYQTMRCYIPEEETFTLVKTDIVFLFKLLYFAGRKINRKENRGKGT